MSDRAILQPAFSPALHMIDEWYRVRYMSSHPAAKIDDAEADRLLDRAEEIEDCLKGIPPVTADEAIAYIGLAKFGIWRELTFGSQSFSYEMFEALLDGAADVLRAANSSNGEGRA